MNLEYIKEQIIKILDFEGDNEVQHILEDDLYREFVEHISKTGTKEQKKLAKECLKTEDIKFERWYS